MKTVVIAPFSSKLHNGKPNAKNYPYFPELIRLLKNKGYYTIQIGVSGEARLEGVNEFRQNLSFKQLEELVWKDETLLISVDSFFPHFCHNIGRACIVLWGKSDPNVFGYKENINILKDRKYLRNAHDQFVFWNDVPFDPEVFVKAEEVMRHIENIDGKVTQK
jgi:ADP-heptose:LPS heptosyltransferase